MTKAKAPVGLMTIDDAAIYLGFSVGGLRTCIHRGELVPNKRGLRGIALFTQEELDNFLTRRAQRYRDRRESKLAEFRAEATVRAERWQARATTKLHGPKQRDAVGLAALARIRAVCDDPPKANKSRARGAKPGA